MHIKHSKGGERFILEVVDVRF